MLYGGHDPGVCAQIIGGFTNWLIGYPDQSLASGNDALSLAERLGHPFTLGITLPPGDRVTPVRREPGMVLQRVHAAEVVAAEQRLSLHINSRVLRGGALAAQGAGAEAVAMIREGLSERNRAGAKLYRPFCLAVFAEALEATGEHDSALAALSEALAVAQETGERWWEAEIHRLKGVVSAVPELPHRQRSQLSALDAYSASPASEITGIARRPRFGLALGRAGATRRSS